MPNDLNYSGPQDADPNEKFPVGGQDHPPISQADAWAETQNPVREESLPAKGLKQGGSSGG